MLRWVFPQFQQKKKLKKRKKMFHSKIRLFFVETKTSQSTELFLNRKQKKVEKLQRNNISCQLTTFLSSQFASFFHIFVFLKRKQPFTCDSYLKKNNKQFLTAGVILRFFRAHTCLYPNIVTTVKSFSTHGPSLSPSQRNDESVW